MRFFIAFLLVCLSWATAGIAQAPAGYSFPEDYIGEWQGDLAIYKGRQAVQHLPMSLSIQPQQGGNLSWELMYFVRQDTVVKDYLLLKDEQRADHYVIDERNEILLDGYVHGGVFLQRFDVGGSLLTVRVERRGEEVLFEIVAGATDAIRRSGDTVWQGEKIPPVRCYALEVRQVAVLKRSDSPPSRKGIK